MTGSLHIICGPMYSGKTEETHRIARRSTIAKRKLKYFYHGLDTQRYEGDGYCSHDDRRCDAEPVFSPNYIYEQAKGVELCIIGEGQFFDPYYEFVAVVFSLVECGVDVVVNMLDMDFRRQPFPTTSILCSVASQVTKLSAVCSVCGKDARYTQRLFKGQPASYYSPIIQVGGVESYEARCDSHHLVPDAPLVFERARDIRLIGI